MASSLISSSHHIDFDSVFGIDDTGLVKMFETLIATGLKEFLGCPSVFYEAALTEFFENSSVRDGVVVSTIRGTTIEISENIFSTTFGLPTEEGLTDFSEVPKDLVFDARSLFSVSKEQVAETADDIVHDAIVVEPVAEQPAVAPVVEDTTDDPDAIIEQVLGQLDSVTTTDSGDQPAGTDAETIPWFDLPFVLATRDSERLFETASDSEDDMDPDVGTHVLPEVQETDVVLETDDVSGTAIGSDVGNQQLQIDADDSRADATIDSFISDPDEEMEPVVEEQSADEAMSLEDILMSISVEGPLPSAGMEITKITMVKKIKIPGVDERTWYLASLPQIQVDVKGKELLVEKDPVKGNPVKEQILLTLADISCLVQLREKVIDEEGLVLTWAEAESTGVALNKKRYILLKYREMLLRKFLEARRINFAPGDGSSTVDLKILDQLSDIHSFVLEELKKETQAHGLMWKKTCCSKIFEGRPRDLGAVIARTNTNTPSRCWIRTMLFVDGVWAVEPCADHWVKIPQPVVQNEVPRQKSYDDTLPPVSGFFKLMKKRWTDVCLEAVEFVGSRRLLLVGSTLRFNDFKKGVLANSASVTADLMDIKKAVRELNAKVDAVSTRLDDVKKDVEATKEAISHQLLDFQAQAQANHNILTGQLSELVNYINRGGNDKKGEGSSRGPQPPPDDQNRDSGNAGGDTARSIVERLISADRERERSRGNISGSYKRIASYSGSFIQMQATVDHLSRCKLQWIIYPDASYSGSFIQMQATVDHLSRCKLQWIIYPDASYSGSFIQTQAIVDRIQSLPNS
ncbi:hypothetical protein F511_08716 [Dorcoceras hygrometricum]|uniref:Uncharacterized protein n=1 Tax=Dorcoceras hygrometricum TaxID=472368 RepID=A0A2Z7BR89_9LAMI|nr:hypothetical protein F511_08716 [Dorcoceras hygrometricum]